MKSEIVLNDGQKIICNGENTHFQYDKELGGIKIYYTDEKEVFYPFAVIKSSTYIYE